MSGRIDEYAAVEALGALAQPTRLAAFRHLVAAYPEGEPAGEIARLCGVPHNTMSTHLGILSRASLVAVERQSRVMSYRAEIEGFRALMSFLTRDCCGGRPEICDPLIADLTCCVPAKKRQRAHA
jgi:DNA-binding transcriptional ArsR family regulator